MPRSRRSGERRLSMRLSDADIALVDRAAKLQRRSRVDFVREAALHAAEDVLIGNSPIRMSEATFKAFMDALAKPTAAVPEMAKLLQHKAPWEIDAED